MSKPKGDRALRSEEISRIRSDLDKRTPDQVAKAEEITRGHVDRNARDEQEKGSFLGQLFGKGK